MHCPLLTSTPGSVVGFKGQTSTFFFVDYLTPSTAESSKRGMTHAGKEPDDATETVLTASQSFPTDGEFSPLERAPHHEFTNECPQISSIHVRGTRYPHFSHKFLHTIVMKISWARAVTS